VCDVQHEGAQGFPDEDKRAYTTSACYHHLVFCLLARKFQAAFLGDLNGDIIIFSLKLAHILRTSKPAYHQLAQWSAIVVVGLKEEIDAPSTSIRAPVHAAAVVGWIMVVDYRIRELEQISLCIKHSLEVTDKALAPTCPICEMRKGLRHLGSCEQHGWLSQSCSIVLVCGVIFFLLLISLIDSSKPKLCC
jgi:hypothetical protein